jgi:hypothetical protein
MQRIRASLALLLSDERSAMQRKAAVVFSLAVLGTVGTGLLLMSSSEELYRDQDRRVLRASQDPTGDGLAANLVARAEVGN